MDPLDIYLKPSPAGQQSPMTTAPISDADPLDIYLKPEGTTVKKEGQRGPVGEFIRGGAYGAAESTSNVLAAAGRAAQFEGGMPLAPFYTPGPEETFNLLQKNVTGELSPGVGGYAQLGRNIGGTLPYLMAMPSGGGLISKLVQ